MEREYAPNAMQDTDHIEAVKELEIGMAMMAVLVLNWTMVLKLHNLQRHDRAC